MRVKTIGAPAIQAVDPQMHSFFNINTPEALADSRRLMQDSGH
jgi:molybdopterin-guanine dinucleotide biosynthesis protein A